MKDIFVSQHFSTNTNIFNINTGNIPISINIVNTKTQEYWYWYMPMNISNCENLVTERLEEIKDKVEQYNKQLDDKRSQLIGFTSAMEDTIIPYVQRYGIIPLQMKTDLKLALLRHGYNATILQRKYERENPNEYQIQVA
ncbi:unnamed protein product [Adineta ricciae]|uniref:Uncharacterized protein n=1 Tax=Adineta ricciae TaxID=249248 RepID=A0A816H961_ADIRI|nr:unnamed protein product [Adineta ricciae]